MDFDIISAFPGMFEGPLAHSIVRRAPIFSAVEAIQERHPAPDSRTVLLCPQGSRYDQATAKRLIGSSRLILICGRYEGIDERVREGLADEEISIGDYVLTGGELPAMVLVDSLTRLLPGALGDEEAPRKDSFYTGRLDHPHYTRPPEFRGLKVPEILKSGNHEAIARWREERALETTARKRPDLLDGRKRGPRALRDH